MNKIFASALMAVAMLGSVSEAEACTNFIVGKKASVDGSVMCSYSADDYGMFQNLCHFPAGKHAKGEMRKRPLLQGARLTAFELQKAGVNVTLICDNMASSVMKQGWVQAVLVGCDRVAANGDTANKIGTSGVAVLAKYYGIPFYVLGPTSTIDMDCPTGKEIKIEERDPAEVTEKWYDRRMAPEGIHVYNPAFDVTPAELITAIITEKGIAYFPFNDTFREWKKNK